MFKIGPMTGNVIKNLITKKSTRQYPFTVREPFEISRGELYNDIDNCIFCSTCARKCPAQCITVDKKTGVWTCDPFACVFCGTCVDTCPTNCLHHKKTWRAVTGQREMITMQGTPPQPKKKAAAKEKTEG
ncbi:4Fe-4S binding protein [Desulfonatronum parangueonense]